MTVFPSSVITWTQVHRERIAALVKPSSAESLNEEVSEFEMQRLELATSIVMCDDCKNRSIRGLALVGSEDIFRHMCLEANLYNPCQAIRLDEVGCAAATSLVSCLGLDPKTTTIKEMDERDARFLCGNCMSEFGTTSLYVYTWMECVRILSPSPQIPVVLSYMSTALAFRINGYAKRCCAPHSCMASFNTRSL